MPDPTGRVSHLPEFHRGVAWKEPCRVATTANITISTALNNGDTLDGVTLATGDRVLVKDQSTGSQNGIYVVGASPARAYDMDQDTTTSVPASEVRGAQVYVIAGTANGGKYFKNTNTNLPVIGTDAITFTENTGGSGAPTNADYLVGTANGSLSSEIVVGTTPGGELGGTWASPTVDSVHSGSAHVALTANTPQAVSTSGAVGSGTASAKDDHVHAHEAAHIQHDTTWAAKGDLIAATANDAASVVSVGSNGQVLTADSAQSTGVKWATAPSGSVATDTIWDAKGDLAAATGADAAVRVPVGSNNQVLVADSAQTAGVKWASVSSVDPAGWTVIKKSADQDVTNAVDQDDSELQFSVTAGKTYLIELTMLTSGNNTTGDFAWKITPAAGTIDGRGHILSFDTGNANSMISAAAIGSASIGTSIGVQGTLGFTNTAFLQITLTFSNTTTAKVQFGNASAGAGRTSRMQKGSLLRYYQTD